MHRTRGWRRPRAQRPSRRSRLPGWCRCRGRWPASRLPLDQLRRLRARPPMPLAPVPSTGSSPATSHRREERNVQMELLGPSGPLRLRPAEEVPRAISAPPTARQHQRQRGCRIWPKRRGELCLDRTPRPERLQRPEWVPRASWRVARTSPVAPVRRGRQRHRRPAARRLRCDRRPPSERPAPEVLAARSRRALWERPRRPRARGSAPWARHPAS